MDERCCGLLRCRTSRAFSCGSSEHFARQRLLLPPEDYSVWPTTVMGIVGALGKMKATSSNLPRRRQFWARGILMFVSAGKV